LRSSFAIKEVLGKSKTDGCLHGKGVCQVRRGEIVETQARVFHGDAPYGYFADNQR
jgi:hypothetical protein